MKRNDDLFSTLASQQPLSEFGAKLKEIADDGIIKHSDKKKFSWKFHSNVNGHHADDNVRINRLAKFLFKDSEILVNDYTAKIAAANRLFKEVQKLQTYYKRGLASDARIVFGPGTQLGFISDTKNLFSSVYFSTGTKVMSSRQVALSDFNTINGNGIFHPRDRYTTAKTTKNFLIQLWASAICQESFGESDGRPVLLNNWDCAFIIHHILKLTNEEMRPKAFAGRMDAEAIRKILEVQIYKDQIFYPLLKDFAGTYYPFSLLDFYRRNKNLKPNVNANKKTSELLSRLVENDIYDFFSPDSPSSEEGRSHIPFDGYAQMLRTHWEI
ncbi:hypothetical protein AZI86_07110 [Bdellovibrio bacteriovorus]|uniref:Uncharacterized protein n=1 Tax=Bdellovibrio bacteriovorus TaxID=959 RepID=A0A150WR69_BDEBC|nr:hypothetical protein [Bdellovibrio bacteriovorus]KYG66799.1 hypothetical protein AZI86_07110 [Bdellovibrio bacteriovorus]